MTSYHSFDPAQGHGLPHDPIKAIVGPRPIGWISSLDSAGTANLAPYSYFNMFSHQPPILIFGSEGRKDTVRNIEQTGEFVFNLATRDLAEAVNQTSAVLPPHIDEFELAGLAKLPSDKVAPPRVAGVAAAMECRLVQVQQLTDLAGAPVDTHLVIGQVVQVHINQACLVDGLFDITRARTIARCGYRGDYVEAGETFEMIRPGR
ncbi:flavin reductase family protein [Devosia ginsengisoli]|uniref:Flavin reductase family protein n=1 Tax=Devosia ginsengisoli TaxID=400770 RepID=A0A5B8LRN3_9HYPH|nr:flavin reductase family protein [Devosia ginsengisoli]QDZ09890.1 flavin reductase family protein [Devosia ginsengisoli]